MSWVRQTRCPRRPQPARIHFVQIHQLLDVLEVPRVGPFQNRHILRKPPGERRGGWWVRNEAQLESILLEIRACYRNAIRRAHGDKGGSHEAAVEVNLAWAKVKRLFARRGVTLD